VGFLSNSCSDLAEHAKSWENFDRKLIHNYWKKNFSANIMAKNYLTYYKMILDGQDLHPNLIHSDPVRISKLMEWKI
jgi:hypothetical protein